MDTPEMVAWPTQNLLARSMVTKRHGHTGDDYRLSLSHPDTGIWLHYETFLSNWFGRMAHQR